MKAVTLQDLADTLGVARSTVSRALRDDPQISPDTRQHVRRLARDLGYHPNAAARALTRRHSGVVGVVLPRSATFVFANPYFATLLEGIASVAEEAGLPILFSASPAPDYERWLREGRVDGLIALGYGLRAVDLERLEGLAGGAAAIALVGAPASATALPTVIASEVPGIAAACDALGRAGHRHLALVTGPVSAPYARARADLWRARVEAAGMAIVETIHADDTQPSGAAAARRLLERDRVPDAWIFGNDAMAFGALGTLAAAGVQIPTDIAVVGFDDVPPAALLGLTTVHQPIRALGEHAMRLVVAALRGGAAPDHTFTTHLEERRTTRSARVHTAESRRGITEDVA